MASKADHDERLTRFLAGLSPHARGRARHGALVVWCHPCRSASFVGTTQDQVRDAWRDHEAGAKHLRKTAPTMP